jgi:membrane-associated phospholipid phosphatase
VAACFGRVFLHVHHILDVVMGALLGVMCGLLLHWQD